MKSKVFCFIAGLVFGIIYNNFADSKNEEVNRLLETRADCYRIWKEQLDKSSTDRYCKLYIYYEFTDSATRKSKWDERTEGLIPLETRIMPVN
jgi:hypothetical protein